MGGGERGRESSDISSASPVRDEKLQHDDQEGFELEWFNFLET